MFTEDNPYMYTPEGEVEIDAPKSDFIDATYGFFHVFTYEIATVLAIPFRRLITYCNKSESMFKEDGKYDKPLVTILILGNVAISLSVPVALFSLSMILLQSIECLLK